MASLRKAFNHVVLVPLPNQGHLPPMLFLARKLAAHGFIVTIINVDSIHSIVQKNWNHVQTQDIRLESIPMEIKFTQGFNADNMSEIAAFFDAVMDLEEPLAALLNRLSMQEESKLCCVISDFYHISAPHAATRAGIPSVCLWSGTASWASIEFNVPSLLSRGHIPVDETNMDQVIDYLPGLDPMKVSDLPWYIYKDFYANVGDERSLFRSKRTKFEPWVLVNSMYELEPQAFDAMEKFVPGRFVAIGPLFPLAPQSSGVTAETSLRPEDPNALRWLDNQAPKSVLYVSFGSVSVITFKEFEELAWGLETSNTRFLFVLPDNLVPDMQKEFFDSFVERNRERGMVVQWAPQLAVLQHESVGGFLTHCGWNSVFESMCSGVPMLGWPCHSEQNFNCKLILEDQGVGLGLRNKNREGIDESIRSLMIGESGDKLRNKAMELQELARAAASPGGSSYRNLSMFFNDVVKLEVNGSCS